MGRSFSWPGRISPSLGPLDDSAGSNVSEVVEYRTWICLICGWIYNEQDGLPAEGIAAGTRFEDIPAAWRCPECAVGKGDFVMAEF